MTDQKQPETKEERNKRYKKYAWIILSIVTLISVGLVQQEEMQQQAVQEARTMSPAERMVEDGLKAKRNRDSQGQQAYVACRSFIREGMASNTKLADVLDFRYEYSFDNDQFYVYSWLEGQNEFGAWLKKRYKCTTEWDAAAKDWKYVDFGWVK